MKTLCAFLFASWALTFTSPPIDTEKQTVHYLIFKGDKPIGNIVAERHQKKGSEEVSFSIVSQADFNVIINVKLAFTFNNLFHGNTLESAVSKNIVNNKTREQTEISRKNNVYHVLVEDEVKTVNATKIDYTMACLYFEEPIDRKKVFSERFGEFLSIKSLKPHVYELTLPDGKTNEYTYVNGKCTEVKVNHFLATLYFRLQ